jgi:sulfhydrogenase subunit gamma (sulfur reductase)
MTIASSYLPYQMKVTKIRGLNPSTKAFTLEFVDKKIRKNFNFTPGQFVIVSVAGFGESVLTITSAPWDLPVVEVAARSVGNNTRAMHRLKVGDTIGLRGPYGNHFDFEKMAGKEVLVVAGGIGLAPLHSFVRTAEKDPHIVGNIKVLYGAKTAQDLIFKDSLARWQDIADVYLTIDAKDKDWRGSIGTVADLINKVGADKNAIALLCGPPVMFESVIAKLEEFGLKESNIYLMLERRMKCGIGKCQHCTCGDKYVCQDGPTFTWAEMKHNWEVFK